MFKVDVELPYLVLHFHTLIFDVHLSLISCETYYITAWLNGLSCWFDILTDFFCFVSKLQLHCTPTHCAKESVMLKVTGTLVGDCCKILSNLWQTVTGIIRYLLVKISFE